MPEYMPKSMPEYMSNKMPHVHGRPNRMPDGMSEYMSDNISAGGDHSKKAFLSFLSEQSKALVLKYFSKLLFTILCIVCTTSWLCANVFKVFILFHDFGNLSLPHDLVNLKSDCLSIEDSK